MRITPTTTALRVTAKSSDYHAKSSASMVGTTYESSMSESKGDLSRIFVLNLLPETKYKDIVDYS
jgi:hypothetical protein